MKRRAWSEGRGGARGRGIATLDRVVFVLLALADLADRVARAPSPVRALVLWVLRRANAVATEFVEATAWSMHGRYWSPAFVCLQHGDDPADPTALASSLRALACIVEDMAAQLRRQPPEWPHRLVHDRQAGLGRSFQDALEGLWRTGCLRVGRLDTS